MTDRAQIITQALHEWRRVGGTSDTFVAERIVEALDRHSVPRGSYPPCRSDLACYRNDGHEGDHLYPTPATLT